MVPKLSMPSSQGLINVSLNGKMDFCRCDYIKAFVMGNLFLLSRCARNGTAETEESKWCDGHSQMLCLADHGTAGARTSMLPSLHAGEGGESICHYSLRKEPGLCA